MATSTRSTPKRVLPEIGHYKATGKLVRYRVGVMPPGGPLGATSHETLEFSAPAGDSDEARGVQFHELLHVRHSPESPDAFVKRLRKPVPTIQSIMAAEDARVNLIGCKTAHGREVLSLLGMSEAEREGMDALCARGLSGDDAYQLACVTVARLGTGAFNAYAEVWKKLGQKLDFYLLSRDVPSIMRKHRHRERATVEVARYLDRFRPVQPGTKNEPPPPWVDTASPWGDTPYGVETPRLSVDCRQAPRRKWRPRSEGSVLRFPHLWPVGAALAHPKRITGPQFKGTVLMDASGSMHLEAEEIAEFARSFPGARLVIYFGGPDKTGREEVGRMFEVAAKGKAIAARDLDRVWNGRDNLIDGPALRWLGKQPGPRVWVSDGGVTGKGVGCSASLLAECRGIQAAYGIVQAPTLKQGLEVCSRLAR